MALPFQQSFLDIERETHPLEQPFIIVASQVPYGGAGTSALSDVQIDRFMFRVWSGHLNKEEEDKILQDIDRISELDIKQVVTLADIIRLQQEAKKVYIGASIRSYIIDILGKLRRHPDLSLGPSPRGGIALFRGARGLASTQGRDFILPDDVKKLLVPTLSSRLRITAEALMVTTEKLTKRGFTTNTH